MYAERPSSIPHTVVWRRVADDDARVVPDGCTDLIWTGDGLLVAGPDTAAHIAEASPGRTLTGLRFGPGVGPAVFGIAVHELRDRRVPLDALWPGAPSRRLAEQLATTADPATTLESTVSASMAPPSPLMVGVAAMLARGATVDDVAAAADLSARQLHRRSVDAFGYGPKLLGRILRFGQAIGLARAGMPLAEVAATCGYSDQAHLTRDVRQLSGVTPTGLAHG